jgi:hypothetical protein
VRTWLFDLGNTRLKCAQLHADGSIDEPLAIAHDDGTAWLDALPSGSVACIASVASDVRRAALFDALCARFTRLHRVRTERVLGPLRIAYDNPAHLGVDRFLSMLGQCGEGASLVVGVGTALTLDLLDGGGLHRGGRIAPSRSCRSRAASTPSSPTIPATHWPRVAKVLRWRWSNAAWGPRPRCWASLRPCACTAAVRISCVTACPATAGNPTRCCAGWRVGMRCASHKLPGCCCARPS